MSWFTKVCFFVVVLSASISFGQRVIFSADSPTATYETRLVATNDKVSSLDIHLSIQGLEINKVGDGFDEVFIDGLSPLDSAGNPGLFTTGSLIAIPDGFEPQISIISQEERELENVMVKPAQKKFRCEGKFNSFQFNSHLYKSNEVFPENHVVLEEVGKLQDLRLARVAIYPVRMNMGRRSLSVTTDLNLRVSFRKVRDAIRPLRLSRTFYQLARRVTANGKALSHDLVVSTGPEVMLVFVADTLKEALTPLVRWEQAKGLTVEVMTLSQAGGTKEKVKETIQNYYNTHSTKPSYLLFVGNGTTMPPFMESTGSGSAASDYPFSLLTGDDIVPDVVYGRIVADNATDLARQITRWMEYEKSPEKGASWYANATTIASNQGSGPSDKEYAQTIQKSLKDFTYKSADGFYEGDHTATAANIMGSLGKGRSWIAYFGHGTGTSWASTNDTLDVTTVGQAANGDKLPVIIDVACLNASYVSLPKCFGKAWVTQQTAAGKNAGAVAFLGGSVSVSWHPPAIMSVGIAKYHFEKAVHTLGGSVLAGQLYLIEKKGTGAEVTDNLKWYNLFGDPSLLMRTDTPKAYQVKHAVTSTERNVSITVTATDAATKGVAGLRVSVSNSKREMAPLAVGTTDSQGQAVLNISGISQLEPNTGLTLTGYNAETFEEMLK